MVTDAERRRLSDAFVRTWGEGEAVALMELLPPAGWSDLARRSDLREVRAELKDDTSVLRGEFAGLRGEFAELRGEFAELRGEFAELRGEFAELRGEVRSQLPKLIAANIASMLAATGVVAAVLQMAS